MIGENLARRDAVDKLRGARVYGDDHRPAACLHVRPVLAGIDHGRIRAVDRRQALAVPGALAVFTCEDYPGHKVTGRLIPDMTVLPLDRIRYRGEIVALAVGETERAAEEAARAVVVEVEELPALFTPQQALEPGAVAIHESGNRVLHRTVERGDVHRVWAEAAVVVEHHYSTPLVEHAYLEPDNAFASWEDDRLIVNGSCQDIHAAQKLVAQTLGLPLERVCVRRNMIGGSFGGKTDPLLELFVALAAYVFRRPAYMRLTREEMFRSSVKRHPAYIHCKSAADRNGRLLAMQASILVDNAAYSYSGPAICSRMLTHATGCYTVPNVRLDLQLVYTNNPPTAAMRGYGEPQIVFAVESQMDEMARALGMDPLAFRRKNALRVGDRTLTEQLLTGSVGLGQTLRAVEDWRRDNPPPPPPPGFVLGRGVASMFFGIGKTGKLDPSTVRLEWDGERLAVYSAVCEMGQGSRQALLQIAAEALEIDSARISIVDNDTETCPDAGITSASRITYTTGRALQDACRRLREQLTAMAQHTPEDVTLPLVVEETFTPEKTAIQLPAFTGEPYPTYAYATQLAEVAVNPGTGEVRLLRVVAAHDVGRAINRRMVCGQIEGGVAMGAGYALSEQYRPGRTESFHAYILPTAQDAPEIIPILIEDEESTGPFGAKGVGEPALVATAPAIVNAIRDAVGVRIYDLPALGEKVFFAMQAQKEGG